MEFLRLWEIVVRRKWILIVTFSVFFATVVIGTHFATPMYEARAKIHIEPSDTLSSLMSTLGLTAAGGRVAFNPQETYDTEIALITIRPILESLISNLSLKGRDGEAIKPEDLIEPSILNTILSRPCLSVERYEESDILEIISNSTSPAEAAKMSNELAGLYIEDRLDQTRKEYKAAREFIEKRIEEIREKYYTSLLEKRDFMIKEETIDLPRESSAILGVISTLENDYRNNEIAVVEANEKIVLLEEKIGEGEYASTAVIDHLESTLNDLLVDVSGRQVQFTSKDPDVSALNQKIDTLKKILREKTKVVIGGKQVSVAPVYQELIRSLMDEYINKKVGEIKRKLLKEYINTAKERLVEIPSKVIKQSELELALSSYQSVYANLLEYLTQVGIAESMTISNIKLVEPAVEPDVDKPDFPKKVLNYVIGVFLGLFLAFSFAFFMEYIDNTIKSPDDIKHIKSLTLLGGIPKTRQLRNNSIISSFDPTSPIVEAYRTIKSSIKYASVDKPIKSFVITSSIALEGKSSVTSNIAITFSMEGKSIIVVDSDLRKPAIHKFFSLPNDRGITNVLAEGMPLENAIVHTSVEGIDVLPSGPVPPDPSKLVESQKLKDIITTLKDMYDMVIIDTPPVMAVNDAIVVSAAADSVVCVIESQKATFSMVEHVREAMEKAGLNLVGVVLNKLKGHGHGRYYYYNDRYYRK